jgi:hypothetical protein
MGDTSTSMVNGLPRSHSWAVSNLHHQLRGKQTLTRIRSPTNILPGLSRSEYSEQVQFLFSPNSFKLPSFNSGVSVWLCYCKKKGEMDGNGEAHNCMVQSGNNLWAPCDWRREVKLEEWWEFYVIAASVNLWRSGG